MPPTQTPNYTVVGAPNPQFEAGPPFTTAGARALVPIGLHLERRLGQRAAARWAGALTPPDSG
jgi:hypothetical protein